MWSFEGYRIRRFLKSMLFIYVLLLFTGLGAVTTAFGVLSLLVKSWLFCICREGRVEYLLCPLYEVFIVYMNRQVYFDSTGKCADFTLPAQTQQFAHLHYTAHAQYTTCFLLSQHTPWPTFKLSSPYSPLARALDFVPPRVKLFRAFPLAGAQLLWFILPFVKSFEFLALFVSFVRLPCIVWLEV